MNFEEFLALFDIELMSYQKELLSKMLNGDIKDKHIIMRPGIGKADVRYLSAVMDALYNAKL